MQNFHQLPSRQKFPNPPHKIATSLQNSETQETRFFRKRRVFSKIQFWGFCEIERFDLKRHMYSVYIWATHKNIALPTDTDKHNEQRMKIDERYIKASIRLMDIVDTEIELRRRKCRCSVCGSSKDLRIDISREVVCRNHWAYRNYIVLRHPELIKCIGDIQEPRTHKPRTHKPRRKRHRVSQDIRQSLMVRANFKCEHCGEAKNLHVHHIVPIRCGGTDSPDNLLLLCGWCHAQEHKDSPIYNAMLANEKFVGEERYRKG